MHKYHGAYFNFFRAAPPAIQKKVEILLSSKLDRDPVSLEDEAGREEQVKPDDL